MLTLIHLIPQEWDNIRVYHSSKVFKFFYYLVCTSVCNTNCKPLQKHICLHHHFDRTPTVNWSLILLLLWVRVHLAHGSRVEILRMNARPPSGWLCLESAAEDLQPGWKLNISSSLALSPTGHQTNESMVWWVPVCDCVSVEANGFTWSGYFADGEPGRVAWRSDGSSDSTHPASAPWRESAAPAPGTSCSNWRWGHTWSSASVNIQCRPEWSVCKDLTKIPSVLREILWIWQTFLSKQKQ